MPEPIKPQPRTPTFLISTSFTPYKQERTAVQFECRRGPKVRKTNQQATENTTAIPPLVITSVAKAPSNPSPRTRLTNSNIDSQATRLTHENPYRNPTLNNGPAINETMARDIAIFVCGSMMQISVGLWPEELGSCFPRPSRSLARRQSYQTVVILSEAKNLCTSPRLVGAEFAHSGAFFHRRMTKLRGPEQIR